MESMSSILTNSSVADTELVTSPPKEFKKVNKDVTNANTKEIGIVAASHRLRRFQAAVCSEASLRSLDQPASRPRCGLAAFIIHGSSSSASSQV